MINTDTAIHHANNLLYKYPIITNPATITIYSKSIIRIPFTKPEELYKNLSVTLSPYLL